MTITEIPFLFDRYGELRTGWRIVLFMLVVLVFGALLIEPMALIPGSLPMLETSLIFIAAFGATIVLTRYVNRKPVSAVGVGLHHTTFRELGAGCLLGFLMMTGIFCVEFGMGWVEVEPRGLTMGAAAWVTAGSLVWFAVGAMGEELLFRGYAFQTLVQAVTFLPATFMMATVFALAHLKNPHVTAFSLLNVALAGILFSIAYMKTRSLWLPFGIHAAWNFSQTTLYGMPTSGIVRESRSLIHSGVSGPEWITGGDFGPEGGVLATIALSVCMWYVLKAGYLNAPEGIVTLDSIEDLLPPGNGEGKSSP